MKYLWVILSLVLRKYCFIQIFWSKIFRFEAIHWNYESCTGHKTKKRYTINDLIPHLALNKQYVCRMLLYDKTNTSNIIKQGKKHFLYHQGKGYWQNYSWKWFKTLSESRCCYAKVPFYHIITLNPRYLINKWKRRL